MAHHREARGEDEEVLRAARRMCHEVSRSQGGLCDIFMPYDPKGRGFISKDDFVLLLDRLGLDYREADALVRRFGSQYADKRIDYMDLSRYMQLADEIVLGKAMIEIKGALGGDDILSQVYTYLQSADTEDTGYVSALAFRNIMVWALPQITELQIQKLVSRFAHPSDRRRIAYLNFFHHINTAHGSPQLIAKSPRRIISSYADKYAFDNEEQLEPCYDDPFYWSPQRRQQELEITKSSRFHSHRTHRPNVSFDLHRDSPRGRKPNFDDYDTDFFRRPASPLLQKSPGRYFTVDDEIPARKSVFLEDYSTEENYHKAHSPAHIYCEGPDDHLFRTAPTPVKKTPYETGMQLCSKFTAKNHWKCLVCFYLNDLNNKTCAMCDALNPHSKDNELCVQCPSCFYVNKATATKCEICDLEIMGSRGAWSPKDVPKKIYQSSDGWRIPDD